MKVFAVLTVARQVDGEYVFVKPEKAFMQASQADAYVVGLNKRYAEAIPSPGGPISCVCERGIFEIEVEENS